jgi:hypothetical protein
MLTLKPFQCETDGYVYIYQRKADQVKLEQGLIAEVVLHKIGSTMKTPESRVAQQEKANKEEYVIVNAYRSTLYKYFEYIAHRYF